MRMKIWLDNERPAPQGYQWCRNAEEFKYLLKQQLGWHQVEFIDIGNKFYNSLEMIEVVNYLQEYLLSFPIHIHSTNTNNDLVDALTRLRAKESVEYRTKELAEMHEDCVYAFINKYIYGEN